MRIHFVARQLAARWPDLQDLERPAIEQQPGRFQGGVNNWVIQTYLQLREPLADLGITASLSEDFEPAAVNITHRDCLNQYFSAAAASYVIGVRADRAPVLAARWELVQNQLAPAAPRRRYLPFWPQPGLLPRDPARGHPLRTLAYFGRVSAAPAWYFDEAFHQALAAHGVRFEIRDRDWHDYRAVDAILACRNEAPTMLREKPASKLVNAWLAGTPALLGDEPAFRSLRRGPLDYLTVGDPRDVLAAVRELQRQPRNFTAMVDNGRQRGAEFTAERTRARWIDLLVNEIGPDFAQWQARNTSAAWLGMRHAWLMTRQKLAGKTFKRRIAAELKLLGVRVRPSPALAMPAGDTLAGLVRPRTAV